MEDGILFLYPFATLYADRTEMTADTRINAVVLSETEETSFRSISLSMTPGDLIAMFPNNNPELAGTREGALLYLQEKNQVIYLKNR